MKDIKEKGAFILTIIESFQKAKEVWTNKKAIIENSESPAGWVQNEVFHACYHSSNGPSARNFYFKTVPESEDFGNIVVFLNKKNQFYQIEATDRGVEITVWTHPDIAEKIDEICEGLITKSREFTKKIAEKGDKKDEMLRTVIIEEMIDETINKAMNNENANAVYFSIGKTREFAANIPLLMNASGANLFQLSLNKWMSAAQQIRATNPEAPFPADKVKPLIANALKWKKYIMDFLNL
ncbi:MAG: putative selenocysteine system protein [Promethearchaeota archaeon]